MIPLVPLHLEPLKDPTLRTFCLDSHSQSQLTLVERPVASQTFLTPAVLK